MENGNMAAAPSCMDSTETLSSSGASGSSTAASTVAASGIPPVRTLFVSGLPLDTKPRELYLLFRACPGFQGSQLRMSGKDGRPPAPVGFVTFKTKAEADEALRTLQGIRFDPECTQTIRLEPARSNTKVVNPKQQQFSPPTTTAMFPAPPPPVTAAFPPGVLQAAAAAAAAAAPQQFIAAAAAPPPPLPTSHHDLVSCLGDPQVTQFLNDHQLLLSAVPQFAAQPPFLLPPAAAAAAAAAAGLPLSPAVTAAAASSASFLQPSVAAFPHLAAAQQLTAAHLNAAMASASAAAAAAAAPACSTLFVANLGSNVNEEELRSVSLILFLKWRSHG